MPDTEIRLYIKGEEYEIVELLKTVFNGWPHFDLKCTPVACMHALSFEEVSLPPALSLLRKGLCNFIKK